MAVPGEPWVELVESGTLQLLSLVTKVTTRHMEDVTAVKWLVNQLITREPTLYQLSTMVHQIHAWI